MWLVTVIQRRDETSRDAHAVAAASAGLASSAGLVSSAASGLASAASAGLASSAAGFSRGATAAGSSICGGFSSTLGGVLCSALGFDLKNSPTRAERRRLTLTFFSSF